METVVRQIEKEERMVLVCSGNLGKFSIDDGMAASAIIDEITKKIIPKLNDLAQSLLMTYRSQNGDLNELLKDCLHLNYLKTMVLQKMLNFAFKKIVFHFARFR